MRGFALVLSLAATQVPYSTAVSPTPSPSPHATRHAFLRSRFINFVAEWFGRSPSLAKGVNEQLLGSSSSFTVTLDSNGYGEDQAGLTTVGSTVDATCSITNLGDVCYSYNPNETVTFGSWNDNPGHKCEDPPMSWSTGTPTDNGSSCQAQCSSYALSNGYTGDFCCAYQHDKSPHACMIGPDGNTAGASGSNWKKCKGTVHEVDDDTSGYLFDITAKDPAGTDETKKVCPGEKYSYSIKTSLGKTTITVKVQSLKENPADDAGLKIKFTCSY